MEMNFRPYFHFKWIPEREREREREEEEDPSSSPVRRSPANPELQSVLIALTNRSRELVWRSHCTARSHELQSDDRTAPLDLASSSPTIASLRSHRNHRTFDLAFDPLIFDPPISLSLSLWFWFLLLWWWCVGGCGFWLPELVVVGWIAVWKNL